MARALHDPSALTYPSVALPKHQPPLEYVMHFSTTLAVIILVSVWVRGDKLLSISPPDGMCDAPFAGCLPADVKLDEIVDAHVVTSSSGDRPPGVDKVTVEQKLTELQASCRDSKLVDGSGREIRFYRLVGCWGNPPRHYQDILQRQREEIDKLKERYTVIEMTCNPSGLPMQ